MTPRHRHRPDKAQHSGTARRHAEVLQETCTARATTDDADPRLGLAEPSRAPGARLDKLGQRLGEGAPATGRVEAIEAPNLDA